MNNPLLCAIESLLFAVGRPLSRGELAQMLDAPSPAIDAALEGAPAYFQERGIALVDDGSTVELRVSASASELIERVRREEYSRDIGRAGLEVLAALLYRGPLSRSDIDFIRGVNSSQTLRTLTMRGLVRKVSNPKDERRYLFEPTTELLSYLGLTRPGDLPDYAATREKLQSLEESYRAAQEGGAPESV